VTSRFFVSKEEDMVCINGVKYYGAEASRKLFEFCRESEKIPEPTVREEIHTPVNPDDDNHI
jgi:hypothetical protein